jgi:hypothetical protein
MVCSFQLDADREVIAIGSKTIAGITRMPGPFIKWNELNHLTIPSYEEMTADLNTGKVSKPPGTRIKTITEKRFNFVAAKPTRRQADTVNHNQADFTHWPLISVGGKHLSGTLYLVISNLHYSPQFTLNGLIDAIISLEVE